MKPVAEPGRPLQLTRESECYLTKSFKQVRDELGHLCVVSSLRGGSKINTKLVVLCHKTFPGGTKKYLPTATFAKYWRGLLREVGESPREVFKNRPNYNLS